MSAFKQLFFYFLLLSIFSNAIADENNPDPWESLNRKTFQFNEKLDQWVARPIAQAYNDYVPKPINDGITNFFENLEDVITSINSLIQGKPKQASSDLGRFLINSTLGVGGILEVASFFDLNKNDEDFGQTLGVWGVKSGPYVILPFWGSSTVRDTAGLITDSRLNAVRYVDDMSIRNQLTAIDLVDTRAKYLDYEEIIIGDKYIFLRDAYLQNRDYVVKDGLVEDEFDEFIDEE